MKLSYLSVLVFLLFTSTGFAQYQQNQKANSDRNIYGNPQGQTIYTVDTSINQVIFGQKTNKRPFVIVFPFRQVQDPKSAFTFTQAQIKGTNMSKNSGVTGIELTSSGFAVTYAPQNKLGSVDDYVVVHTENGEVYLRLTGEITDSKKKKE